jgi:hypothetical protein
MRMQSGERRGDDQLGLDRGEQGGGAVPAATFAPTGKLLCATAEKGRERADGHRRRAGRGAPR